MNVFLCWSGAASEKVAKALHEWLGDVIQALRPFMSSESIRKGDRWRSEIAEKLAATNFGILCLTAENLNSRWILFEAGALSKHLRDSRVTALLIGIDAAQVVDPLSQFQATPAARDHIFQLVKQLNGLLPTEQQLTPPERLQRALEANWPRLESAIAAAQEQQPSAGASPLKRTSEDMIEETLRLVRVISRAIERPKRRTYNIRSALENELLPPRWLDSLDDTPETREAIKLLISLQGRNPTESLDKVHELWKTHWLSGEPPKSPEG
jgi:hypothetical protein